MSRLTFGALAFPVLRGGDQVGEAHADACGPSTTGDLDGSLEYGWRALRSNKDTSADNNQPFEDLWAGRDGEARLGVRCGDGKSR